MRKSYAIKRHKINESFQNQVENVSRDSIEKKGLDAFEEDLIGNFEKIGKFLFDQLILLGPSVHESELLRDYSAVYELPEGLHLFYKYSEKRMEFYVFYLFDRELGINDIDFDALIELYPEIEEMEMTEKESYMLCKEKGAFNTKGYFGFALSDYLVMFGNDTDVQLGFYVNSNLMRNIDDKEPFYKCDLCPICGRVNLDANFTPDRYGSPHFPPSLNFLSKFVKASKILKNNGKNIKKYIGNIGPFGLSDFTENLMDQFRPLLNTTNESFGNQISNVTKEDIEKEGLESKGFVRQYINEIKTVLFNYLSPDDEYLDAVYFYQIFNYPSGCIVPIEDAIIDEYNDSLVAVDICVYFPEYFPYEIDYLNDVVQVQVNWYDCEKVEDGKSIKIDEDSFEPWQELENMYKTEPKNFMKIYNYFKNIEEHYKQ